MKIIPIILCGGDGQRLWPLSRSSFPKQFHQLIGEHTLFQQSVLRLTSPQKPVIVTGEKYRFVVRQQLQAIDQDDADVIIEPSKRNTAPSILVAACHINDYNPHGIMLIMPSDHYIPNSASLNETIKRASTEIESGQIICFGIKPDRPETGYGYIDTKNEDGFIKRVNQFIEKPVKETAEKFLQSENFLWNAGIFMVRAGDLLEIAQNLEPEMYDAVKTSYSNSKRDLDFIRLNASSWNALESQSFDYAFMEKSNNIGCIPYSDSWSDLGDWNAIAQEYGSDPDGNIVHGNAHLIDCENSMLWANNSDQVLTGIGLNNIVAVAMEDAVLVSDRNDAQSIKSMVEKLKSQNIPQATERQQDNRPWGWYKTISHGDNFKVKILNVYPGEALSLQSHQYRSEHWVVVSGVATVIRNDQEFTVHENESVYIHANDKHQLRNETNKKLIIIEVQTGQSFDEDDIVRYHDKYAR